MTFRTSHLRCSVRKGVLRNFAKFTGKYLYQSFFFNTIAGFLQLYKKEALGQVFSCEFCEISKNTFFTEHLRTTAPGYFFLGLKINRDVKIYYESRQMLTSVDECR